MLIGEAHGKGSANIHAAVPGTVIRKVAWNDSEGHSTNALLIRTGGSFDRLGKEETVFPWAGMSSSELQNLIAEYGVVEMEGLGRPVAELIEEFRNSGEQFSLVVRCIFDDPWLAADYVLCMERLKAIVEGAFIAAQAGGNARHVLFAVSAKERELGQMMLAEAGQWELPAMLVLTGSRYPQHNRRELELVLRTYEKKKSAHFGPFLILGPATLAAVYDAVKLKKPALERFVAVGGSAVRRPQVMKARIGKRLGDLFDECGGFIGKPHRIATGSPLSGKGVVSLDEPVTKTSYAVFAMLKSQDGASVSRDCISCGECRRVCPVGLDPEEMYKQIMGINITAVPGVNDCHGCGCCEVVCPSQLRLSSIIRGSVNMENYT
jgi:electron transport complex protein RnfC